MNLPNLISLARLLSVPLAVWMILEGRYTSAFWIFVVAGLSDAVDGMLAKYLDARSTLGKFLDPLADKALLVSVYVALGRIGEMDVWLVILVVSRDVMIVGGVIVTLLSVMRAYAITPSYISKANTAAQILLAAAVLARLGLDIDSLGLETVLVYVVALTTLASGAWYLVAWYRQMAGMEDAP
ncbi:MAG TPA: CDP-alcohol phosphatidyltransferase family protein [Alphaproteobacteria bacterium]